MGGYVFAEVGTKNDGIQRIVKGYVYLGGYVLNYLLKVTGGTLFTKGTFIWHNIVLQDHSKTTLRQLKQIKQDQPINQFQPIKQF